MGKIILVASLGLILALSLWVMFAGLNLHGDVEISGHGLFAMALGIFFSLVVGVGLMALVFYSSRAGYDRQAEREHRRDE